MIKVGLLNFHYSQNNYGAVLQAAALQEFLISKGYSPENINFRPKTVTKSLKPRLLLKIKQLVKLIFNNKSEFDNFRDIYIKEGELFHDSTKLKKISANYEAIVVGSDQVWRPNYTSPNTMVYFLSNIEVGVKAISYAASFGVEDWSESHDITLDITTALKRFSSISVREDSGKDICRDIFGVEVQHVLDPTLLVDSSFFEQIIGNDKVLGSDIVYYKLDASDKFHNMVSRIEESKGYSSENIYKTKGKFGTKYISVKDWLYKIKHSKLVITDSFHCICFAIIFKKQFIYYPNDERGMARIQSLLSSFGLSNRILYKEKDVEELLESEIDYDMVEKELYKRKIHSEKFLLDSLLNG
ncbi:polysaccharide pyruvyl transferase family protein [Vibrio owensii]|uniref:polysaccharide pyruvyl transferase family protein n=1 Tax=Vibrio owensii TaxID=696485 RepID=UPI003DA12AA9